MAKLLKKSKQASSAITIGTLSGKDLKEISRNIQQQDQTRTNQDLPSRPGPGLFDIHRRLRSRPEPPA